MCTKVTIKHQHSSSGIIYSHKTSVFFCKGITYSHKTSTFFQRDNPGYKTSSCANAISILAGQLLHSPNWSILASTNLRFFKVFVRFVKDSESQTKSAGIISPKNPDPEGLYNAILDGLAKSRPAF